VRQWLTIAALCAAIVVVTRVPLQTGQLYSFDSVNFAYAIGEFDIERSQPQPPGYPIFVLETRILTALRFKNPESVLSALRLVGSFLSLLLLYWAGQRIFDRRAALIGVLLMSVYPAFYFAGLTSAVRVQLVIVSTAVAGACWAAWNGGESAAKWSGFLLGIGAGIRPELGLLLLPLWAVGVWRAAASWRRRSQLTAVLVLSVFAWLIPTALASGGIVKYFRINWNYLRSDSAGLTSGLLGADTATWQMYFVWLVVWTFSGLLGLTLPAVLAGRALSRMQALFLMLWFAPSFAFAALVHVADPGHVLAMLPVIALLGGRLIARAAERLSGQMSHLLAVVLLAFPASLVWVYLKMRPEALLYALAGGGLAAGGMLLWRRTAHRWIPRWQAEVILLLPSLVLFSFIWFHKNWFYSAKTANVSEIIRQHLHSGLASATLHQVRLVTWGDDSTIQRIRELAAERPQEAVVVWRDGLIEWRKVQYYLSDMPIWVLERKGVVKLVRGRQIVSVIKPPVELPKGVRLIWLERKGMRYEDVPAVAGAPRLPGSFR